MSYYAMRPVEIGVCQAPVQSAGVSGVWGFHIVNIPASTPEKDILAAATRAYLAEQEDTHVYHTWVQHVGNKNITVRGIKYVKKVRVVMSRHSPHCSVKTVQYV